MAHSRADVVSHALDVLDRYGLADLSMRRLATELDVRPSALYWHVSSKQELLASVADELLARGARPGPLPGTAWDACVRHHASTLRDAVLAYRDGAEVVATTRAYGLGARRPFDELVAAFAAGGCDAEVAHGAATTVWHLVLGHAGDEQTQLQADSAGAVTGTADEHLGEPASRTASFDLGVDLIVTGVRARLHATTQR
ncbi:MAG: TetR/AcrR family transcriptional regulator C-terminal domain-containing protein [Nocardioidaceae bacterium]|nr:TetR/AcrR family transcriptional regulator C-terminal domain-containing protein [Nocardioidaceae bacterium]